MEKRIKQFHLSSSSIMSEYFNYSINDALECVAKKDFDHALTICKKLKETKDPFVYVILCFLYWQGLGTPVNENKAKHYLKKLNLDNFEYCYQLTCLYYKFLCQKELNITEKKFCTKIDNYNFPSAFLLYACSCYHSSQDNNIRINIVKLYKRIAMFHNDNFPEILYLMGLYNKNGYGIKRDYKKALSYISKAVLDGYHPAIFELGKMYIKGDGIKRNYAKAFKLINDAASNNNIKAQCLLASMYEYGLGTNVSYLRAYFWYKVAYQYGYSSAAIRIVDLIANNKIKSINNNDVEYILSEDNVKLNRNCLVYIKAISKILLLNNSDNVTISNLDNTKDYDHSFLIKNLASWTNYSITSDKTNLKEGIELLQQAVNLGSSDAYSLLGLFYLIGVPPFVPKNINIGLNYLIKAASKGDIKAKYNFGKFVCEQLPNDYCYYRKAIGYLKELISIDYLDSYLLLAKLYINLSNIKPNLYKFAKRYLVESAYRGNNYAKLYLVKEYHLGTHGEIDDLLAYYYAYRITNKNVCDNFCSLLDEIKNNLTEEQIELIQQEFVNN